MCRKRANSFTRYISIDKNLGISLSFFVDWRWIMILQNLTFEEEFSYFSTKFELGYILDGIEIWLDFRNVQKDIFLFIKSINEHHDGPPTQRDTSKDFMLDQILEFDFHYSIYSEINLAFSKLNDQEKLDFYKIFLKKEIPNFFRKYDLVVKLASLTDNFVFSNIVLENYKNLKKEYLTKIRSETEKRKSEITNFSQLYESLVFPDWSDTCTWYKGNGEASRRKKMFVLATLLKDGLISEDYFFELIQMYRGAKKYYKYVVSHI